MTAMLAGVVLAACSSGSSSNPPATPSTGSGGQSTNAGSGGAGTGGAAGPSGSGGAGQPGSGGATTVATGGTGGTPSGSGGLAAGASGGTGPVGTGGGTSSGTGGGVAGKSGSGGGAGSPTGAGGGSGAGATVGAGGGFVDLFNGTDLTGFNVYKATTTANNSPGMLLTGADALAVFKPENGTIHVYPDQADQSVQSHYLLQTVNPYANFSVSWDYKWGTKKFALDATGKGTDLVAYPRDAGVLWYIHGDKTQIWPSSIEFQNKWGSTGDIFALYAQCKSLGLPSDLTQFAEAAAGGVSTTVIGGLTQHKRSGNFETPGVGTGASTGQGSDWNTCLLEVNAGTATYTVNGHIVNRTLGVMDSSGKPVTSGYIAWQGEQAEVYYRNLRIQVLP